MRIKSLVPKFAMMLDMATKTVSVGEQHHDGCDSPGHAEHGKSRAATLMAHRVVGLAEKIAQHKN